MAIETGDSITIEYVGRFEDGSVFDTSRYAVAAEHGLDEAQDNDEDDYGPLSFTVGEGEVIEGLDEAVVGMTEGEESTITVPPAKGYGEFNPEWVREYNAETFEGMVGKPPEVGMHVHAEGGMHGDVTAVRDDVVEVDFNHELADQTLTFEIEVIGAW